MKHWRGPQYEGEFPTLGYEVADWLHAHLPSPSDDTKPWTPTDEQYRLLLHWYRLDPQSGRFVHRRGALEMAKGWGKSPLVAALALADFAGPARFDGWDAAGEPVARPWGRGDDPPPWVQVAANSEDQSENTYGAIYSYLTARDGEVAERLGIDHGRTRLYLRDVRGSRLEPVTASAGSREGQRTTFAVLDETHLWTRRSGGAKLANTLRRNVGKMDGRTIETTNAPVLGEDSVAERTGKAAEEREPGIWFHATRPKQEPMPDWPDERLRAGLEEVYGDSWWVDRDRILREVKDPATDWSDALRFYFNTRTAGTGRAVDPRRWEELRRSQPDDIGPIGIGFDGSLSQDATALVACTEDGYSFVLGWWERPKDVAEWTVDRRQVHAAVDDAFARYRVGLMLCDPPYWHSEIAEWQDRHGEKRVLPFDTAQPRRMAPAVNRWRTAIAEGTHTHPGDERLTRHVLTAHLRKVNINAPDDDGRTHYVIEKGDAGARIDGAVADILALEAVQTMEPPEPIAEVRFTPF